MLLCLLASFSDLIASLSYSVAMVGQSQQHRTPRWNSSNWATACAIHTEEKTIKLSSLTGKNYGDRSIYDVMDEYLSQKRILMYVIAQ